MPEFSGEDNEGIDALLEEASLMGWRQNYDAFHKTGQMLFLSRCAALGRRSGEIPSLQCLKRFSTLRIYMEGVFSDASNANPKPSDAFYNITIGQIDGIEALLNKNATVNFIADTSLFLDKDQAALR